MNRHRAIRAERERRPLWSGWVRLVAAGSTALLLAACGGGEVDGDDAALDENDDVEDVEPDAPEPASDADGDEGDEGDEEDEADDASSDGDGPAQHRPPPEAQELVDCAAIDEPSPGALIVFPSDEDPSWLDAGPGPVTVEVVGCSDTFEANLQYEAFHGQDSTPTLEGFTEGGTLGTWAPFSIEETYWTPGEWTVVVFDNDAESGDRVEYDEVSFTVD